MKIAKIIFLLCAIWLYLPCMAQLSLFQNRILIPELAPVSKMAANAISVNKTPAITVGNDAPSPLCSLVSKACGVLQVNLIAFKAERLNNGAAKLNWITVNEINNRGFVIERSLSPAESFEPRGFVPGNADSQIKNDYQYEDNNNYTFTTFYRLKITNTDGGFSYSETRTVPPAKITNKISIYPNPTADEVNISILLPGTTEVTFVLTDATLRSIMQWTKKLTAGANKVSLNIQSIAAGSYFIVIHQKDKADQVLRFFKM